MGEGDDDADDAEDNEKATGSTQEERSPKLSGKTSSRLSPSKGKTKSKSSSQTRTRNSSSSSGSGSSSKAPLSSRTFHHLRQRRRPRSSASSSTAAVAFTRRRQCTDVGCCVLFVLCLAVWISIGVAFATYLLFNHGLSFGLAPLDSQGNRCGQGRLSSRPYLFFFNIVDCINAKLLLFGVAGAGCGGGGGGADGSAAQVCVDHCPNVTFSVYDRLQKEKEEVEGGGGGRGEVAAGGENDWLKRLICKYDIEVPTRENVEELWKRGDCAGYYLDSAPFFDRCIPKMIRFTEDQKAVDEMQQEVMQLNQSGVPALTRETVEQVMDGLSRLFSVGNFLRNVLDDLRHSLQLIFLVIFLGILLSLFWLYSLACFTRPVVWGSLLALIGLTAYLLYLCAARYSLCLAAETAAQAAEAEAAAEKKGKGKGVNQNPFERTLNESAAAAAVAENITSLAAFEQRFGKGAGLQLTSEQRNRRSQHPRKLNRESNTANQVLLFLFDGLLLKVNDWAGGLLRSSALWLGLTVASAALLLVLLVGAGLLADRINLAICLIEETSTALAALRCLVVLLLPLVPYLLQLTATGLWAAVSLALYAASRPTYLREGTLEECVPSSSSSSSFDLAGAGNHSSESTEGEGEGSCQLRTPLSGTVMLLCQLFSFFSYQWLFYFLEALYIISLAGCFSTFYWQPPGAASSKTGGKKRNRRSRLPQFISLHAVRMAIRYHLGTLAFGAFFVALLRLLRLLLYFLHGRLKAATTTKETPEGAAPAAATATAAAATAVTAAAAPSSIFSLFSVLFCCNCGSCCSSLFTSLPLLLRLAQWLLSLTDRLLSFLNHHTYLMTAIYGRPFCESAAEAVGLLASNPLRSAVLYITSHYLLAVLRLAITLATAAAAFLLFVLAGSDPLLFPVPLHYRWAPVVVASAVTYLVSGLYLDVYEVGLDTMFLSFLLDDKLHDGSRRRPYFMPNATRQRLLQLDSEVQRRRNRKSGRQEWSSLPSSF